MLVKYHEKCDVVNIKLIFLKLEDLRRYKMESKTASNGSEFITVNRPIKVLHFSDGVEEIIEENEVNDLQTSPNKETVDVDPATLSWGPWFSYHTWKSGSKCLSAIDYAGESLSDFFGITTPKYSIEIAEFERMQQEKKKLEDESQGWVPKTVGGDIPLVLKEPVKTDKPEDV